MKKEQLAKMNLEELKEKIKSNRFMSGLLTVIVIALFLVVFIYKPESSTASKIVPFAFLPMVFTQIFSDYKLNKELKSRQNK